MKVKVILSHVYYIKKYIYNSATSIILLKLLPLKVIFIPKIYQFNFISQLKLSFHNNREAFKPQHYNTN